VNDKSLRCPLLDSLYEQFLESEDSAAFMHAVSRHYTVATLERLAEFGSFTSRRAGVFGLTFLGDYRSNAVLGRALHDRDRGVRMLADNGIRDLWQRDGDNGQRQELRQIIYLNVTNRYREAVAAADRLIEAAPWFAETWNQRGLAYFHLKRFEGAANDCHQTLELNAYHFPAAIGLGHCYLEMQEGFAALECFRRALRLNPDLEDVRVQVDYLARTLEER
jgi:tetratricopeptide (TPR) repeat protein